MKTIVATFAAAIVATLQADYTNVIDIAALAACGSGATNGWTLVNVDSYSDKTSVRLNAKDDELVSPEYAQEIKSVILKVKSSAQTGRKLTFFPYVSGVASPGDAISCEYSPNKDTYVPQSLDFPPDLHAKRLRIAFDNPSDGQTAWGFSELAIVTDASPRFASPENVAADRIRATTARIRWEGNDLVASNLVTVALHTEVPESFTIVKDYDFSLCSNTGSTGTQDRSENFHDLYPDFTSEKLYYPALSEGVVQISTSSANGRLTHCGFTDYSDKAIEVTAKRDSRDSFSKISLYYIGNGTQTNEIGVINIGDDFTATRISLSGVPAHAAISLGNLDGRKSNRRFLVDRIVFLDNYTPAHTENDVIKTIVVPHGNSVALNGLTKQTAYTVTVTAIDESSNFAEPSAPLVFTTATSDGSIMFIY